jgi:hypothetical protein
VWVEVAKYHLEILHTWLHEFFCYIMMAIVLIVFKLCDNLDLLQVDTRLWGKCEGSSNLVNFNCAKEHSKKWMNTLVHLVHMLWFDSISLWCVNVGISNIDKKWNYNIWARFIRKIIIGIQQIFDGRNVNHFLCWIILGLQQFVLQDLFNAIN